MGRSGPPQACALSPHLKVRFQVALVLIQEIQHGNRTVTVESLKFLANQGVSPSSIRVILKGPADAPQRLRTFQGKFRTW